MPQLLTNARWILINAATFTVLIVSRMNGQLLRAFWWWIMLCLLMINPLRVVLYRHHVRAVRMIWATTLIPKFMGPTWGPSGADRTQVGPMLAARTLLSRDTLFRCVCKELPPFPRHGRSHCSNYVFWRRPRNGRLDEDIVLCTKAWA